MTKLINLTLILLIFTFVSCIHKSEENGKSQNGNIQYMKIKSNEKFTENSNIEFDFSICKFSERDKIFVNDFISVHLSGLLESEIVNTELNKENINKLIDSYTNLLKKDYRDIEEDFPSSDFYYNIRIDTAFQNKRLLIINESYENYTGGAHGNYMSNYYTFDIESKIRISFNDIFQKEKIEELAQSYFLKAQGIEKKSIDWEAEGYWFENNQFHLTDNFYFTNKQLVFVYNPYEIASYAQGRIDIEIPYSALKNAIKDKYKYLLN